MIKQDLYIYKMKRNWKTLKPLENSSNQQRQQTIVEEKLHPCDTPTTPVMGDRNVEKEEMEDRNNDSGISFSYSTPNVSGLLTPICNQLSSSMVYDSPSTSTEQIPRFHTFKQQQNTQDQYTIDLSTTAAFTTTVKPDKEDIIEPPKKCLLCPFATNRRSVYTDHILSHFSLMNNPNIDAASESAQVAESEPFYDDTWENAEEVDEDVDLPGPSKRTKATTIKRKKKGVKYKRCKQCDFVVISKLQYWIHLRTHLNDNGYTCSLCPFVTKYKHHMTHHWFSTHDHLKLFECSKCTYSCVSKSMLSSHMKTHSNIYQYNCGTCSYKTKFFNAIKKHLQDTMHKAGPILDTDGKLNPEATLDVFGNKRGPRCKSSAKDKLNQDNNWSSAASFSQTLIAPRVTEEINGTNETNQDNTGQIPSLLPLSYPNDLVRNWNSQHSENAGSVGDMQYNSQINILLNYMNTIYMLEKHKVLNEMLRRDIDTNKSDSLNAPSEKKMTESTDEPLDLSMPDMNANQQQRLCKSATYVPNVTENRESTTKMEHLDEEENMHQNKTKSPIISEYLLASGSDFQVETQRINTKNDDKINGNTFTCEFCQIGFANQTMYYAHMSYHSSNDPFTCKKCGNKCSSNVDFYVHLIKMKH